MDKTRDRCRIVVMAKAPRPGLAKTRLIPALGADGAARLAEKLLQRTVDAAISSGVGPVELCCTPDTAHPAFARAAANAAVELTLQVDGDLGRRMADATERALQRSAAVLLIGTDAPALDAAGLQRAREALRQHDVVLVPAFDGGYALIGLTRPLPQLFEAIAWSTPQVLSQTRMRLGQLAVAHIELPAVADIDEPQDLRHLPAQWR